MTDYEAYYRLAEINYRAGLIDLAVLIGDGDYHASLALFEDWNDIVWC